MNTLIFFAVCLAVASAADYRRPGLVKKPTEHKKPVEAIEEPIVELVKPKSIRKPNAPTEEELEQNKNAKYEFSSDVKDEIRDLTSHRHEVRDGLKVVGEYSFSDGFFKRTTYYEADENGFRVTKQEEEPLAGPVENLSSGEAVVSYKAHGSETDYKIKSVLHDDIYSYDEIL